MDKNVKLQVVEFMNSTDVVNMQYNQSVKILETIIRRIIAEVIKNIYEELNHVRYLGNDHNIWKQLLKIY